MLTFIHIGKTGGTTINSILSNCNIKYKEYHMKRNYKNKDKYIIWLRNPISRFVSAFNFSHHLVNYNCINKNPKDINMSNCLYPPIIKTKIINKRGYVFHPRFDKLIKFFGTANNLADGLTSNNPEIKEKAIELMNYESKGHIFKGIGWYLNNGKFVENNINKILFVGKQETMKEDIEKLSGILNINLNIDIVVRENIYSSEESKYLSPIAITNLIEFYKNTDYAALKQLNKYGWISDEVLASYYKYS